MDLRTELREAAELSLSGVAERTIETCIVNILRSAGWSLRQIEQDVPVSDKGIDRADVVVRHQDRPLLLAEVKRYGQMRDGQSAIRRYCALMRPRVAVLTDGVRWIFYYVGPSDVYEIFDGAVPEKLAEVAAILTALAPKNIEALLSSAAFGYLDMVARGLGDLSEDARRPLMPHFAMTVGALLSHGAHVRPLPSRRKGSTGEPCTETPVSYSPDGPPDLRHTSILRGHFADEEISSWTSLVHAAVRHALLHAGRSLGELQQVVGAHIVEGELSDRGFRPVHGTQVSVQGMEARRAWNDALAVARDTGARLELHFTWQQVEGAARPGEHGVLQWPASPGT